MSCISYATRFRGPAAARIRNAVRRTGRRVAWADYRQWKVWVLDGSAYLMAHGRLIRLDWFEFRAVRSAKLAGRHRLTGAA